MDQEILLFFETLRSAPLDTWMGILTWLGSEQVAVPVVCVILWCVDKTLGYRLGTALFFSQGLNQTLKVVCAVPRPWVRWPGVVQPVASAVPAATGYSFPSGHTSTAAALYPTLAMRGGPATSGKRVRVATAALAGLALLVVGITRVYLGVHTPTDVWSSALITLAVVVVANVLFDRIGQGRVSDRAVLAGGLVFSALVIAFATAVSLLRSDTHPEMAEQALDAFKAGGAMAGFTLGWAAEKRWIRAEVKAPPMIQLLKIVCGIGVLLVLKEGIKPVLELLIPYAPVADGLRYALVALWATCGLPAAVRWIRLRLRRVPRSG
ncbi:MAG: phosphatase PAP2 family protein [Clostridiaceae bacterium]|nr:phosphatase PAP2 family protein [Clostridiaceae bacterium]